MTSLRQLHGRGMNNLSNAYSLPADDQEHDRLAVQHQMWRLLFGGLCPSGLELDTILDSESIVLDVGCGGGHWSLDFAREHPTVRVIGFDLAKIANIENMPPNFQFIQGDIKKDMSQFFGRVSLLNCRCVLSHLKEFTPSLDLFYQCLKPGRYWILGSTNDLREAGGLILIAEADVEVFSRDKQSHAINAENSDSTDIVTRSWVSKFLTELVDLVGEGIDLSELHFPRLLQKHGGFTDISAQDYFAPFGWSGDGIEHGYELSQINSINLPALALGYVPAFLEGHRAPDVVEKWRKGVQAEVSNPAVERYLICHAGWGRRL